MKCMILGFDGLEYEIVNRLDLMGLKQEECGKVKIPIECYIKVSSHLFTEPYYEPWTPLIWYSFLTGKLPSSRFCRDMKLGGKWNYKALNMLETLSLKLGLGDFRGIRILRKLGFRKKYPLVKDYGVPTIFDLTHKAIDIDVPVYSEEWGFMRGGGKRPNEDFDDFVNRSLRLELNMFDRVKNRTLAHLEEERNWTLLMMYTRLLDTYGELSFNRELDKVYFIVDDFAKKVKNLLSSDTFILIISDHGIEEFGKAGFGRHSNYGFYSINTCLGLKNPKITDFYSLIKSVLEDNIKYLYFSSTARAKLSEKA